MKKDRLQKKGPLKKNPVENTPQQILLNSQKTIPDLLGLAIVIVLGVLIYSNSFNCSFHFDDFPNFLDNTKFPDLLNFKAWWKYSHTRLIGFYSLALNLHFNQLNVWAFHLVNLIIHLINSCMVWWLTVLIFSCPAIKDHPISKYKKELAFLTALLFVSHPLATQSVTYIVQRFSSLVALFYLLSIALYIKARLIDKTTNYKYLLFAGSFISALLAMLTKENAFTLPFAILLVEYFLIRNNKFNINFRNKRNILLMAGFIGFMLLIAFNFKTSIFKPILPNGTHPYTLTSSNYLFSQFSVIVKYIQLLFLPINQMLNYDFPISNSLFRIHTLFSFLFLIAILFGAIMLFKKHRMISFGICWFFLCLSIESSIIPIQDVIFEHRTYLPSFGFFLILCSGLYILFREKNKNLVFIIFTIIIGFNSILSFQRNKIWKDELSLWNDNVKKAPNLARAIHNRGFVYKDLGQWDKALVDYNKALEIEPNFADAYSNRGVVYAHFKQWDKAIADYSKAIKIDPDFTDPYSNRGIAYASINQWDKALADYSKAIEMDPKNPRAYYNRCIAYRGHKEWDKAITDCSTALTIDPSYKEAYVSRANAYGDLGLREKAIVDYSTALKMDPNFADAYFNRGIAYRNLNEPDKAIADYSSAISFNPSFVIAYYNRGNVFGSLNKLDKAIDDYNKVIEIDPNFEQAYSNRGAIFAKLGQWEKAIADYTKALQINPNDGIAFSNREIAYTKIK